MPKGEEPKVTTRGVTKLVGRAVMRAAQEKRMCEMTMTFEEKMAAAEHVVDGIEKELAVDLSFEQRVFLIGYLLSVLDAAEALPIGE